MKTIVVTSTDSLWNEAQKAKTYTQSTINSTLNDVGFIHATSPDQTIAMLNRHFSDRDDIVLLLVDVEKVRSEIRFEKSLSSRGGIYPHIYGPLNTDAVYDTIRPTKEHDGDFIVPNKFDQL
ncbi:DUF952 domain-containing protein [Candidatus Saccharibacteria bacterium]|nr:DUF952 domain-containing protein [Candidatus Saccharibacteria bacterium]